jgi:transcriptional regulator with XRE-family HTH domain
VDAFQRRTLETVAANVRRQRVAANLTQAGLAEALELEPGFIQTVESARAAPSFKTLCSIARVFGIEVRELFAPAPRAARNPGRPRSRPAE